MLNAIDRLAHLGSPLAAAGPAPCNCVRAPCTGCIPKELRERAAAIESALNAYASCILSKIDAAKLIGTAIGGGGPVGVDAETWKNWRKTWGARFRALQATTEVKCNTGASPGAPSIQSSVVQSVVDWVRAHGQILALGLAGLVVLRLVVKD